MFAANSFHLDKREGLDFTGSFNGAVVGSIGSTGIIMVRKSG